MTTVERKADVLTIPPIVARGVMIDVAGYKNTDALPSSYEITVEDLQGALAVDFLNGACEHRTRGPYGRASAQIATHCGQRSLTVAAENDSSWLAKVFLVRPRPFVSVACLSDRRDSMVRSSRSRRERANV